PDLPGAAIDPLTGLFTWNVPINLPNPSVPRILTIKISDNTPAVLDSKSCVITILNAPPVLDALPPRTAHVNRVLTFIANATDPDGDGLTYSMTPFPDPQFPGGFINGQTGQFIWFVPPNLPNPGVPRLLTVTVTDTSGASDSKQCLIT